MKLDKETVVKQQFWFLLGGFFLFWLISVVWIKFASGDKIEAAKAEYTKTEATLKKAKQNPRNPAVYCPPWRAFGSVFDGHKRLIWGQAWELQKGMYNWPFAFAVETPQTPISQDDREKFRRDLYPKEIKELRDWAPGALAPVELAGGFDAVFKPQKLDETPTREECWLVQEDYWVKRDLLYAIAQAVGDQAYMRRVEKIDEKVEPLPDGVKYRHRFHNLNWEVTLLIKENAKKELVVSKDSTIKNIHPSGRVQLLATAKGEGIFFNVYQDKTYQRMELKGEPVPSEKVVPFGTDYAMRGIDWKDAKKPPSMSQAFEWSTSPIRRIDDIEIRQQSCRTYTTALQPNDTLAKLDVTAPAEGETKTETPAAGAGMMGMAGGSGGMTMPPGGAQGGSQMMPPGMGAGAPGGMGGTGAAESANLTPNNKIDRNRYLQAPKKDNEPEKPSRHLPFAIRLIVDQAHMHDVLLFAANSRLRIQITQVEFHRARGIRQQTDSDKGGGNDLLTGPVNMPPGMSDMYSQGAGSTMRPPGMGTTGPPAGAMGSMGPPPGAMGSMGPPPGTMGSMMPPGMGGMKMPPGMMGGMPMGMPGAASGGMPPIGPKGASSTTGDTGKKQNQDDENLVEMTIYGVSTLYRLPDPPKAAEQTTPAPTAPAPAAPTTPAPAAPK